MFSPEEHEETEVAVVVTDDGTIGGAVSELLFKDGTVLVNGVGGYFEYPPTSVAE
jgi:hypothetical protein